MQKKLIIKILLIVSSILTLNAETLEEYSALSIKETKPGNYLDFGVYGKEYSIEENDFQKELMEGIKKFNLNEENLKKKIKQLVRKSAYKTTELPLCKKDIHYSPEIDYAPERTEEIRNPEGRLIYKKGVKERIPLKLGISYDICFIDGRNNIVAINQIEYYKKQGDCLFLVANKNVLGLRKKYPDEQIFPTSPAQEQRFGIECYPAKVHLVNDTRELFYNAYDKFKN